MPLLFLMSDIDIYKWLMNRFRRNKISQGEWLDEKCICMARGGREVD